MVNAMANGVWKKALKTLVNSICAVVITNLADPKGNVFSWEWFRHLLLAIGLLVLFNEAKYWEKWSSSPDDDNSNTPTGGIGNASILKLK